MKIDEIVNDTFNRWIQQMVPSLGAGEFNQKLTNFDDDSSTTP